MSSTIPRSFTFLHPEEAASGERDRERITRNISYNSNYIYGNKLLKMQHVTGIWQTTGTLASTYMDSGSMGINVIGANVATTRYLGTFTIPQSLSNTQDVKILVAYDNSLNTMATLELKIDSKDDNITTQSLAISSTAPSTMSRVSPGSIVHVYIKSNGVSNAVPGQLKSIYVYYEEGKYAQRYRRFSPTKATFSLPNVPDCSAVYRRLIDSHANIINEPTTIMNRYYGLPWTNRLTTWTTVGEYLFYTDPLTENILCHVYARRGGATAGDFRVVLNDSVKFTETSIGTTWTLYGGYLIAASAGALNKLQIQARMTSGDGTGLGIQVAGVYCWEETRIGVAATSDSVPTSFVGNDTDSLVLPRFKIYADEAERVTSSNKHVGKQQLNKDVVWLKSNRRQMYVNDWRHRCHSGDWGPTGHTAGPGDGVFANMVSASLNTIDMTYSGNPVDGTSDTVLARHLFPATSGTFTGARVNIDFATPRHPSVDYDPNINWDVRAQSISVDGVINTIERNGITSPEHALLGQTTANPGNVGLAEFVNGFTGLGDAYALDPVGGIRLDIGNLTLDTDRKTEIVIEAKRQYPARRSYQPDLVDFDHVMSMDRFICYGVDIKAELDDDVIP